MFSGPGYGVAVNLLDQVLAALGPPGTALSEADGIVPERPGLYAIYGEPATWKGLGLGSPPDLRPLYVGKSESSLASRDLRTHFGDGRTGSSTVRRSFAALLREPLALRAQPRNPARPERFANYGLPVDHDVRLTTWMRDRLRIAIWAKTGDEALATTEQTVLQRWEPPLNLQAVITPWTAQVKSARAVMAAEAKASVA
jgi:hypothetical protein